MINNGIANMCSCIAKKEFKCVTLLFYFMIPHKLFVTPLFVTWVQLTPNCHVIVNFAGVANTSSII